MLRTSTSPSVGKAETEKGTAAKRSRLSDELSSGGRWWIKQAWIEVDGGSSRLTAEEKKLCGPGTAENNVVLFPVTDVG